MCGTYSLGKRLRTLRCSVRAIIQGNDESSSWKEWNIRSEGEAWCSQVMTRASLLFVVGACVCRERACILTLGTPRT